MSDRWLQWLSRQRFASWESFRVRYEGRGKVRRQPWQPVELAETFQLAWVKEAAAMKPAAYLEPRAGSPRAGWLCDRLVEDEQGRWRVANRLDCADFGNRTIYCAIGANDVETTPDLSRIIKLCGPQKRDIPLSLPHYDLPGGHQYVRIDATRILLYGCSYRVGGHKRSLLFRELPSQRQRRIRGAATIVTTVENAEVRITMIDFAPRNPDLSLACRVFVAENLAAAEISRLEIHHLLASSRGTWTTRAEPHGALVMDRDDDTGVRLASPAFAGPGPAGMLEGRPEQAWQSLDLPLLLSEIRPGGSQSGWSLVIPVIRGGDPDEEQAIAEAERFEPMERLEATLRAWTAWSEEVRLTSDLPILADLADSLQVLLKTHEGSRGYHLGTTYQRHTHCWTRDNYLMHHGLLAAGRVDEAATNLGGFVRCWRQSGICCGYNVFTGASWIPRASAELCSYLLLTARDLELWTGAPPSGESWEMITACADTLALNSRGLAGFDGDEIWFWELDPSLFRTGDGRSLREPETLAEFSVLDNCWLVLCALEYAECAAVARGEAGKAAAWGAKRARIEQALEKEMWDEERGLYAALLFPDGTRYPGPLVCGFCTPSYFGVPERHPGSYRAMVLACGRGLMTPEGVVKGNEETVVYAGLTPAFYLHALGSAREYAEGDRYLEELIRALPSSGATWEYSVADMPYTGTDKRRGGDSGVLLAALMDYIVGFRPTWAGFTIRPHLPRACASVSLAGLRLRGHLLAVEVAATESRVELDGRPLATIPAGAGLAWDGASGSVELA